MTEAYGQYSIEVSGLLYTGGKWLSSDNPDAEMREYSKGLIPGILGRDMISTDKLYINGVLQDQIDPKEGDTRTVNCPKTGLPIQQIFQYGQWRTIDADIPKCKQEEYMSVAVKALKAGVFLSVISSLLN